jgi:hypothetical protein
METIDDIRREDGNPRSGAVGGKPRTVFAFFSGASGSRIVAMILIVIGLLALVAGAILFIAPLMIGGLVLLVIAGLAYFWARPTPSMR